MSSSMAASVEKPPGNTRAKHERSRILAGIAVLAIVLLLLGWGLSAMQWTILTTSNNINDAVATHKIQTETVQYSIPLGVQRNYPECIDFSTGCIGYPSATLPTPVSNSSTTIQDYAVFSVTSPNGTAVMIWYTSPQGNLTQNCSGVVGAILVVGCDHEPNPPGTSTGPFSNLVLISTPGNYSIHLLSERCSYSSSCSTTTATGNLILAVSTITYSRPYYSAGLVTVIIAGVSIAVALAFLTITGYRIVDDRGKRRRPMAPAFQPLPEVD